MLILYVHEVNSVYIDVGDPDYSPGDYFMFVRQVRYSQGGPVVGRSTGRCTVGPSSTSICDGTTLIFGKGKIVGYSGYFPDRADRDNHSAVTGGTGVYQEVGGQFTTTGLRDGALIIYEIKR